MAVAPPLCTDFDDIDLSTPNSSPKIAPVPRSMGTAAKMSSSMVPQGGPVPALPLTTLNPGTEQHHPLNPTVIKGNLGMIVNSSNLPVGLSASLAPPGGKCRSSLTPDSAGSSCPTNTDRSMLLITEAAAKQAFHEYGNSKCCYGSSPAKDMTTAELQPFNTYRYSLETFTESRTCEWITEQYTGQHVDATNAGSVLQPWEIPVVVPDMFKDGTQTMKVPNTTSVKTCPHCKGMGKNMCLKCHGTGRIQCMWCNGTGRRLQMEMCQQCYGIGTESCRMCNPSIIQNCVTCTGKGQVLTYLQLSTTWKNNKYQFISDDYSEFSPDLFHAVHGERIHTDEQLSASPLSNFPDATITWASQNALDQHRMQFSSSCRVLRQRQCVELLPLTKVQYVWKGKKLSYFVYGTENKVFVQNYPQKCCCAVM
ncbi:protein SSUH2 homolog [Anomaloglossus baeobatrachus]|uniref:protein SSUH2 homolog n=1 Tax=Anomaloglossus baeobatrachus TaxID=238106 RepID=UPI003F509E4D